MSTTIEAITLCVFLIVACYSPDDPEDEGGYTDQNNSIAGDLDAKGDNIVNCGANQWLRACGDTTR